MANRDQPSEQAIQGLDNYMGRWVYPLMDRIGSRNILRHWVQLQKLQYLPHEQLKTRQEERLRRLVEHCYRNVDFYRRKFDSLGIDPGSIRKLEDLSCLPPLQKAELRRETPRGLMARNLQRKRAVEDRTSGSVGEPMRFFHDRNSRDAYLASFLLFNQWAGILPGDRSVHIGAPVKTSLKNRLYDIIRGHTVLSAFEVNPSNLDRVFRKLRKLEPDLIEGYSSSIFQLARFLLGSNIRLRPRAIVCTSDTLPHFPTVEEAFACPVFNRYGNREQCGALAQNCSPRGGLHVNTEICILEVVDETGRVVQPGQRGRILVTDLTNYVMPFIRYDTGDTAMAGDGCGCGRGFPVISQLEGRGSESLSLLSGRRISSIALTHYLFVYHDYVDHFSFFQAEQFSRDRILFRFVPAGFIGEKMKFRLRKDLQELLGPEADIAIEFVDAIPAAASGKRMVILSHVNNTDTPGK